MRVTVVVNLPPMLTIVQYEWENISKPICLGRSLTTLILIGAIPLGHLPEHLITYPINHCRHILKLPNHPALILFDSYGWNNADFLLRSTGKIRGVNPYA